MLSSCMGPQTSFGSFTAGVCSLLCFLAGGDSSQDEAEDDVKQITVCPHFPFYAGSGKSSQESLTIHSKVKGQQTSAGPAGLGWVGEARGTHPCCTGIKMALRARGDSLELGPLAWY